MIKPVAKMLLVKRAPVDLGGLIIVPRADKKQKVELLAVGKQVEIDVQVGDKLLITGGFQFDDSDEDHLLVNERDVIGVVV